MSMYAVALINHMGDIGLQLRAVTASSWWDALETAFPGHLANLGDVLDVGALEEAKTVAFNQDWEFDVLRIVE